MFSDLQGRTAIVFGVANKRSIAWSIAQGLHSAGARLIITYQNERLEQEARDLIASLPGTEGFMCDISKNDKIDRLFAQVKERYGKLHVLVHSVAYAPAENSRRIRKHHPEGFRVAHDISVYSLIAVARRCPDGRRRQHHHHDLLRRGKSRSPLQRHGRCQAALECSVRYLAFDLGKRDSRERNLGRAIKTLAARGISG
jgi:enoyl-[acyl-carrier protein] reductase I